MAIRIRNPNKGRLLRVKVGFRAIKSLPTPILKRIPQPTGQLP